jgi:RNA recognition motif-containing protein
MSGTRIFIKNLASRTTEQDINEIFGKFGEVTKIDLKTGFGFIFYAHADDADEAIKSMNDREVDGKVITVEMARDEKKKPVKRLDLRVSVSGMGSGVSWQDLKDWAREAGDVTFTNCFMRDGQNCGVVEFQVDF